MSGSRWVITPSWLSGSWRSFLYTSSVYSYHIFLISSISVKKESEVAQLCLTLCDSMDCSLPGSTIHGIFQARILEWVAISFSRRSSWPRDWTQVSHMVGIVGRRFTIWATRKDQSQRNQKSNCQHPLDHRKSKRVPEKHLPYWLWQSLWLWGSQ